MANNYNEIMKIVNQGNKMGLSNTITRDNGIPLDLSSVQPNYETAVIYAATKAIAYVGQPVAVGNKLYIISETAAETKFVASDGKEYDNFLVEVGSKTEGDNVTIDLEAGVLRLHGFEDALAGYIPQKKAVYKEGSETEIDHYELEWVAISAIVEGDGNKVTTLTSEDGSVTVTKKTDTDESLVYDLSVEKYDDTALVGRVEAIEQDYLKAEDKYDDTALANRVKVVEDAVNHETTGLAAHEKRIADMEAFWATTEDANEVVDTLKEIQDYIASDETGAATMAGNIQKNTEAITKLNGDASTEGSVDKKIADHAAAAAEVYATKDELGAHVEAAEAKYAVATTVNEALAKKIENATVAHTTEGVAEGVTLNGTTMNIVVDAYTKEETLTKIQEKITEINGGESAGEVLGQLNSYKETNDAAVAAINAKIGTAGEGQNDEGDTLYSLVAEAQTQANKGVADAASALGVANEAKTKAENNATDITGHLTRIEALETAKGEQATAISGLNGRVAALEGEDVKINTAIGTLQGNVTALQGEDGRLAGLINANTQAITKLNGGAGIEGSVDYKIAVAIDAIPAVDLAPYLKSEDAVKTYATIEALSAEAETARAAEQANANAIAVLVGSVEGDDTKSVRTIAAEETAKIVAGADEKYDTLKEIADYIANDTTNAATIANDIAALKTKVDTGDKTVSAYVTDAISAIPGLAIATAETLGGVLSAKDDEVVVNEVTTYVTKANAVYVDNVGAMSVKKVTTDILVNGEFELILNGGNATGKVNA